MVLFSDEFQTADDLVFKYVHPSFGKGEAMWFSLVKTDRDSQRMDAMIAEHGGDTAALYDRVRAMVVATCRRWTLKLPKSFRQPVLDVDGEIIYDDEGRVITELHSLAGKVPPITWDYVTRLPDTVLRDIVSEVSAKYAGPLATKEGVKSLPSAAPGTPPPTDA